MFRDREEAGFRLAGQFRHRPLVDPVVLAIPYGGVVVGAILAAELDAELDVVLARKLRAPIHPELAIGAMVETGAAYLNDGLSDVAGLTCGYLSDEYRRQLAEITRSKHLFRSVRSRALVAGRSVIITDDGIDTGATMLAALRAVRGRAAHEVIVAVPVAPPDRLREIRRWCDEVVCLLQPESMAPVGQFYGDFTAVSEEQVLDLLSEFNSPLFLDSSAVPALP